MRRSRRRFQSCTGDTCIAQSDAAEVYTVALHQPRHNLSGLDPRQARHGPRNHQRAYEDSISISPALFRLIHTCVNVNECLCARVRRFN